MFTVSRRRSTRLSSLIATLLSGVMAFQLLLAGSGMLCIMPQGGGTTPMASMTSMQPVRPTPHHVAEQSPGVAQRLARTDMPSQQPCDSQGVPLQCVTMAACAPSVIPSVAAAVARIAPRAPSLAIGAPVMALLSQTSAPELPPPRA